MPWQFFIHKRRTFHSLFFGAEFHLSQACDFSKKIEEQKLRGIKIVDQRLWMQEKVESRACFLVGFSALESFVNHIITDFTIRDKNDLSRSLLNKNQKNQSIFRWKLIDKIFTVSDIIAY